MKIESFRQVKVFEESPL